MANRSKRWFVYSLIGLFLFLSLSITLAAILLLQRGRLPRSGVITGSSMEPVLQGPRLSWTCPDCSASQEFALDTCNSHQPFRCRWCGQRDPKSAVDFDSDESYQEKILPGDQVRYATLRSMRSQRAMQIATGTAQPSGLVRGDIVVFQESEGAKREVKRVVGFPSERIDIEGGDVFVNRERWCKSLEQSLRQSILLDAWQAANRLQDKGPQTNLQARWVLTDEAPSVAFDGVLRPRNTKADDSASAALTIERKLQFRSPTSTDLDNQLPLNAHDSHAIVPIQDFGIAFQIMKPDAAWEIRCHMHSPVCDPEITIQWSGSEFKLTQAEVTILSPSIASIDKPIWIAIAMVDGFLVVGSQDEEWFRAKLPSKAEDSATESSGAKAPESLGAKAPESLGAKAPESLGAKAPESSGAKAPESFGAKAPVEICLISGTLTLDQLLVFRDIHYRGQADSEAQVWEPGDQLIVLGDNVSCSSDSRNRWPQGLATQAVKGVVLQMESPMEVLLRQRR